MHMYKEFVKKFLIERIRKKRLAENMTKSKMSECLRIDPRSYADLESGHSSVSAPSVLFFLNFIGEEQAKELLDEFQEEVERLDKEGQVRRGH